MEPTITVSVAGLAPLADELDDAVRFYVMGAMNGTGAVESDREITLIEAIAMVGGPSPFAATDRIQLRRRDATRTARRAAGVRVSALGAAWLAMPGAGADVTASSPCAHCRCSLTPRRSKVAQACHEFVLLALRHGGAGGAAEPLGAAKRPRRASKRWGARVGAVRPRPLGA